MNKYCGRMEGAGRAKGSYGSDFPLRSAAGRSRHETTWTRKSPIGASPSIDSSDALDLEEIEPVKDVLKVRLNALPCTGLLEALLLDGLRNMMSTGHP
jgi:hypothetical protein